VQQGCDTTELARGKLVKGSLAGECPGSFAGRSRWPGWREHLACRQNYGYMMSMETFIRESAMMLNFARISFWEWALAGVAVLFLLVSIWRLWLRRKRNDTQVLHHFNMKEFKRRQQQQDPDSTGLR